MPREGGVNISSFNINKRYYRGDRHDSLSVYEML
jgi:hypothetical protein